MLPTGTPAAMTDTTIRPPKPGFDFATYLRSFTPKIVIALREGYPASRFGQDALPGMTVAILALPLSMAIAIGAGIDRRTRG